MVRRRWGVFVFLALWILSGIVLAWASGDSPEGHVESASGIPDGKIYASTTTSITTLLGTAQKGGADQAAANAAVLEYRLFMWRDVDRDGEADLDDEPTSGYTTLDGAHNNSTLTITVASTNTFPSTYPYFIKITDSVNGDELLKVSAKAEETFTVTSRGYNETSAAAHDDGRSVSRVQTWELLAIYTTDGSPYAAIGFDSSGVGLDDGTEGDLLQGVTSMSVVSGEYWLLKLRVIDASGNTNTEVAAVDKFYTYGASCYLDGDGDAAQGLEDDEVVNFAIGRTPRRIYR